MLIFRAVLSYATHECCIRSCAHAWEGEMAAKKLVNSNNDAWVTEAMTEALSESFLAAQEKKSSEFMVKRALQICTEEITSDQTVHGLVVQKRDRYIRTVFRNRLSELMNPESLKEITENELVAICLEANKGALAAFHVRSLTNMPGMYDESFIETTYNLAIAKVVNSFRKASPEKKKQFNKVKYVENLFLTSLKNSLRDFKGKQFAQMRGFGTEILGGAVGPTAADNELLITEKMEANFRRKVILNRLAELREQSESEDDKLLYAITEARLLGLASKDIAALYSLHMSYVRDYKNNIENLLKKTPDLYEELREVFNDCDKEYDASLTNAPQEHVLATIQKKVVHSKYRDMIFKSEDDFANFAKTQGIPENEITKMSRELRVFKPFEPSYSWKPNGNKYNGSVRFLNESNDAVITLECINQESPEKVKSALKELMLDFKKGK